MKTTAAKQWTALAEARRARSYPAPAAKEKRVNPEILKSLGLDEGADEAAVLAAVKKLKNDQAVSEAQLADTREELAETKQVADRVTKLEAALAASTHVHTAVVVLTR